LVVVLLDLALLLLTRLFNPPWIFVGELIASALILRHALRHEDGGYRRAGLGVVGGFMLWWGVTDIAAVHVVTPYAAVFTAAGAALVGASVWGVISRRPLRQASSPG
jgi:hypothetical protein